MGPSSKRPWVESYCGYVYKQLKMTHPDVEISRETMAIMNSLCIDLFERCSLSAAQMVRSERRRITMYPRDIKFAVNLVMSGDLAVKANEKGDHAVHQFLKVWKCPYRRRKSKRVV